MTLARYSHKLIYNVSKPRDKLFSAQAFLFFNVLHSGKIKHNIILSKASHLSKSDDFILLS